MMQNRKKNNTIEGLPQFYKNAAIHFSGKTTV